MSSPFRDLGVAKKLTESLHRSGITSPFPIQSDTLPPALGGRDLCGRAPTGSGKTLAFAIPVVENIGEARPHHPRALVLVPTRELANQVRETILPLAQARDKWVASFYGGTSIGRDISRLQRGVDIAVATPGRLTDLVERGQVQLDELDVVVIDEADRMADMGFLPVVRRLLDQAPADRQTLLFSATLDGDVDVLVRHYQHDPVRVEIDAPEDEQGQVDHLFWATDRHSRRDLATRILDRSGSAIVFTRTRHGADRLARQLSKAGVATAAIHGNRSQRQREAALARFASGQVAALVATDVAARGIHVDAVDLVVHYDLPSTDKDYVHRSGRTGRAGARGMVVSLVCEDQHADVQGLQRSLEMSVGLDEINIDQLAVGAPRARSPQRRSRTRSEGGPGAAEGQGGGTRVHGDQGGREARPRSARRNGKGGAGRGGAPRGGARRSRARSRQR